MGSVIDFSIGNYSIAVQRTEEFNIIAQRASEFIKDLPLTAKQNDELVSLIVEQVKEAERGALMQGFQMGLDIAKG